MSTPASSVYTPTGSSIAGSIDSLSFSQSGTFVSDPSSPTPPSSPRSEPSNSSLSTNDDAEAEWQESLQQLELLFSLVVIPFFGKWVGRRCAYWGTHPCPLAVPLASTLETDLLSRFSLV
jgi:hypothetical protein